MKLRTLFFLSVILLFVLLFRLERDRRLDNRADAAVGRLYRRQQAYRRDDTVSLDDLLGDIS